MHVTIISRPLTLAELVQRDVHGFHAQLLAELEVLVLDDGVSKDTRIQTRWGEFSVAVIEQYLRDCDGDT